MDKAPLKKNNNKKNLKPSNVFFKATASPLKWFVCHLFAVSSAQKCTRISTLVQSSPPLSTLLGVTNWPLILPFPAGFIWTVYPGQQVHLGSRVSQPWRQRLSGSRETVSRNGLRFQILVAQAPWGQDAAEKAAGRVSRGRGWGTDRGLGCESEGGTMLWSPPRAPGPRRHPVHPTLPPARGTTGKVMFYLEWFRRQTLKPP